MCNRQAIINHVLENGDELSHLIAKEAYALNQLEITLKERDDLIRFNKELIEALRAMSDLFDDGNVYAGWAAQSLSRIALLKAYRLSFPQV